MREIRFAWDAGKSEINRRKHGVSFEEAQTVFFDDDAIQYFDADHATAEDRFLLLGVSFLSRTLMVCHCYHESDDVIRIISARKATSHERRAYTSRKR